MSHMPTLPPPIQRFPCAHFSELANSISSVKLDPHSMLWSTPTTCPMQLHKVIVWTSYLATDQQFSNFFMHTSSRIVKSYKLSICFNDTEWLVDQWQFYARCQSSNLPYNIEAVLSPQGLRPTIQSVFRDCPRLTQGWLAYTYAAIQPLGKG